MNYSIKKKILSLVLCICLLVPMLTQVVPIYSVETGTDATVDLGVNVGKQAIFDGWSEFLLVDDPARGDIFDIYGTDTTTAHADGEYYWYLYEQKEDSEELYINAEGVVTVIDDYYYDETNGFHWYKLAARSGEALPEGLQEKPWVLYTLDGDDIDPYLAIYDEDDVIRFVTSETSYVTEDGEEVYLVNNYVFSGPDALEDAEITVTSLDVEYTPSALSYGTWYDVYDISIKKADGNVWSASDGNVAIRYLPLMFDMGTIDVYNGAAYIYSGDSVISAKVSDLLGYSISDVIVTNTGEASLVLEHLSNSFEEIDSIGYFNVESVNLYDNSLVNYKSFKAAELPVTFNVAYSYTDENNTAWYWLESESLIGSPYFMVQADYVTLGKLPESFGDGRVTIVDEDGNAVDKVTVGLYEKTELSANTSFTTSDIDYQWQVEYEEGKWADIYDMTSGSIKLSFGLLYAVLGDDLTANIRCAASTAVAKAYSSSVAVTIDTNKIEEPDIKLSDVYVSSEGEIVTVKVTGSMPYDASVKLKETDSEGIYIDSGEKVVAAIDVSILNSDGTEWQPESGETVTVSLKASQIGLEEGDEFTVYHLHAGETKNVGTYTVKDGMISFETDGFSKFVFVVEDDPDYSYLFGMYAMFNAINEWTGDGYFDYFWLKADPSSADEEIYTWSIYDEDFEIDQVVKISDYYIDAEKQLWLEVEGVNGLELPESLKERSWVYMNNLEVYDSEYDALFVFEPEDISEEDISVLDKYGLSVWKLYITADDKREITVQTNLTGDVKYRWEVCYDIDNLLWTAIEGETSSSLNLSYGMLSGVIQDGGWAALRCVAYNAVESVTSNVIIARVLNTFKSEPVIIVTTDPEAYEALFGSKVMMAYSVAPAAAEKVIVTLTAKKEGDDTIILREPYELEYNGSVNKTAELPYIKGYDLYDGETKLEPVTVDGVLKYYYTVNMSGVTDDTAIDLLYKPGKTTYTVSYYLQNWDDEDYVKYGDSIILEGKTGELVDVTKDAFNESFDGFYQLLFETATIASDGSTDIEIYYDRLYYKMLFDLDGGYGVQPVYARYETPVSVKDPTKAGYVFMGWDSNKKWIASDMSDATDIDADNDVDIIKFVDVKVPNYHTSYTAIWEPSSTAKVTVVVWGQNADDDGYSYMSEASENLSFNAKPEIEVSYNPNGGYICGMEVHTHSTGCNTTCSKTEHTHSVANGCYDLICGMTEHTEHTDACWSCGGIKNHSISCYESSNGNLSTTPVDAATKLAINSNARVTNGGLYSYNFRYYFKLGDDYYEVTSARNDYVNWYTEVTLKDNCGHTNLHTEHDSSCVMTCVEHTHSDSCYELKCITPVHTHTASCFSCGQVAHTHGASCSLTISGMDSDLWEYSHSDTITVAADGSSTLNVYFVRKEFTLTFNYSYYSSGWNNSYYQKKDTITARWGQNISAEFVKITDDAGSSFWAVTDGGSTYVNYIGIMPQYDDEFWNRGASGSDGVMTYYGEGLDGNWKEMFSVSGVGGYHVTIEDRYEFEGFTYDHGTDTGEDCEGATFYYTRNKYNLVFDNYTKNVRNELVYYEAPLSSYGSYSLDSSYAPSIYQEGSVAFKGWYLSPQTPNDFDFSKVEPFDFENSKMPASDLILYAWWQPVSHNVSFYHSYEALEAGNVYTAEGYEYSYPVLHGDKIEAPSYRPPADPTNGRYTFEGWFYVNENGIETMWDFDNSTVTSDVKIYAKWTSNTLMPYTVMFVYVDENGNEIEIADRITGSALAGNTKTFEAKAGSALYTEYQSRYFPVVASHSLTIDIDDETKNVYKFYYVYREQVPYTVYYITKDDPGTNLGTTTYNGETYYMIAEKAEYPDNEKVIVTENAKIISGYVFDEYQKRLMVDPNDASKNVIYFIYEKDTVNGQFVVHYMTENVSGTGFDEHSSFTGKMSGGSTYTVPNPPKEIEHFTWSQGYNDGTNVEKLTGTVEIGKVLELWVYYTRDSYSYKVQYLDEFTGLPLLDDKTGEAKWQTQVSESYVEINGYELVNNESYTIDISDDPKYNVITFYYVKDVKINYQVVGPAGCGTVDPTTETLKALSGTANGSVATASKGYDFVGWFSDADCKDPVGDNAKFVPTKDADAYWVDGTTYYAKFVEQEVTINYEVIGPAGCGTVTPESETVPVVSGDPSSIAAPSSNVYKFIGWYYDEACTTPVSGEGWLTENGSEINPQKIDGVHVAATYYAKFEYNLTSLTITKTGDYDEYEAIDPEQTFIFDVVGKDDGVSLTVTVHGNGKVTIDGLTVGNEYTVTERTDWSWRYEPTEASQSITVVPDKTQNVLTFDNDRDKSLWLDGDSYEVNTFNGTSKNSD